MKSPSEPYGILREASQGVVLGGRFSASIVGVLSFQFSFSFSHGHLKDTLWLEEHEDNFNFERRCRGE